jgi:hypothetical protein
LGDLSPDVCISGQAFGFIEGDKLDVRYVAQQACFGFADDPGDAGLRPVILEVAHDGKRMAGSEQVRQVDNKGRNR